MKFIDIFEVDMPRCGHVLGAWDCPCDPWVRTYADESPQYRTIRHVGFGEVS